MSDSKVLATVAGVSITEADIDAYISNMPQQQQAYASNPQFRAQVLNQIVSIQLFAEKGKEDKLDESEEYAKLVEAAKRDILAQMAIQQMLSAIQISDEDLLAYYEANKSQYGKGESVGAKHILVDTEEKCNEAKAVIVAGEKTFEDMAKECSTCPSGQQGGDLGEFGRGQMVPEFDKAAFEAEVNQIVGPVKTQFGYHLIQVYKKNEAQIKPFEEVKDAVKNAVMQSKQQEAYSAALSELGNKYLA